MKDRLARTLVGVGIIVALAAPAGATHGGIHPTFKSQRVYIHCAGANKVQNLALVTDGVPQWDTNAPAASFTSGAGCGALDPGALSGGNQSTIYDAVFEGAIVGNIRDMTIELHNLLLSQARQVPTFQVRVRMSIDGTSVWPETAGKTVTVTPVLSSTGLTEKFEISITGLGCAKDVLDADGKVVNVIAKGLAAEDGDGESERMVHFAIDSLVANQASAWVWDATEVPSGATFNPSTLAAAKIAVPSPSVC